MSSASHRRRRSQGCRLSGAQPPGGQRRPPSRIPGSPLPSSRVRRWDVLHTGGRYRVRPVTCRLHEGPGGWYYRPRVAHGSCRSAPTAPRTSPRSGGMPSRSGGASVPAPHNRADHAIAMTDPSCGDGLEESWDPGDRQPGVEAPNTSKAMGPVFSNSAWRRLYRERRAWERIGLIRSPATRPKWRRLPVTNSRS